MDGTLSAGGCERCGHDRVSVCLYVFAGIGTLSRRADKRGERNIREVDDGAVALLECDD